MVVRTTDRQEKNGGETSVSITRSSSAVMRVIGSLSKGGQRIIVAISLSLLLAACSMVGSGILDVLNQDTCHSSAGTYFLPKSEIHIVVRSVTFKDSTDDNNKHTGPLNLIEFIKAERTVDRERSYCLDYLGSPTADDAFAVKKTKLGLLERISTIADDKSEDIAKTLIKTIFTGLSGNPDFDPERVNAFRSGNLKSGLAGQREFEAVYDPFNSAQTDLMNFGLTKLDFCLVLKGQLEAIKGQPDYIKAWRRAKSKNRNLTPQEYYCSDPLGSRSREQVLQEAEQGGIDSYADNLGSYKDNWSSGAYPVEISSPISDRRRSWKDVCIRDDQGRLIDPHDPHCSKKPAREQARSRPRPERGIFYRARVPYPVYLYSKVNDKWHLRGADMLEFENESPTFNLLVDRTFFAKRETKLIFDEGVLRDIQVEKGSELVGFVEIPLVIAQSIVALPANIIQVKIDQTNNRKQLIDAQNSLLKIIKQNNKLKGKPDAKLALPRSAGGFRSLGGGATADFGGAVTFRSTIGSGDFTGGSFNPTSAVNRIAACMQSCSGVQVVCRKVCQCTDSCLAQGQTSTACLNACKR